MMSQNPNWQSIIDSKSLFRNQQKLPADKQCSYAGNHMAFNSPIESQAYQQAKAKNTSFFVAKRKQSSMLKKWAIYPLRHLLLRNEPNSLQKTMSKTILVAVSCLCSLSTQAIEDLDFSGFARVIAGQLDTKHAEFKGYDDSWELRPDSLLGVQATYSFVDSLSITSQAILRADRDDESELEWLYLTYEPIESIQIKAGKLRTPFFTLSDVTDVGYAYPWINPPQQVYNAYLFDTFEGIDFVYGYTGKSFDASIEIYAGQYDGDIEFGDQSTDFSVRGMKGIIGKLRFSNLELRVARYGARVEFDDGPITTLSDTLRLFGFSRSADSLRTDGDVTANQVGLVYDNLRYFTRAEWIDIQTDLEVAPTVESYYLTLGFYLSPMTFHMTYANSRNSIGTQEQEIPTGISPILDQLAFGYGAVFNSISRDNLKSLTLGARWDFRKNMALKIEHSKLRGKPGEDAFFDITNSAEFDRKANLYLIGLEWVF